MPTVIQQDIARRGGLGGVHSPHVHASMTNKAGAEVSEQRSLHCASCCAVSTKHRVCSVMVAYLCSKSCLSNRRLPAAVSTCLATLVTVNDLAAENTPRSYTSCTRLTLLTLVGPGVTSAQLENAMSAAPVATCSIGLRQRGKDTCP